VVGTYLGTLILRDPVITAATTPYYAVALRVYLLPGNDAAKLCACLVLCRLAIAMLASLGSQQRPVGLAMWAV
jgi:hypothetical protein